MNRVPSQRNVDTAPPAASPGRGSRPCFHCGEPCPDAAFEAEGKNFCCQGCRVVHDLLTENGLGHFYDLNRHPGPRVRSANRETWTCLDDPEVGRRLLDYSDARISKVTFHIPAIHCVACVWLLENLFQLHAGIGQSKVNFPRREVAITYVTGRLRLSELVALLASIGYEPALTLGALERSAGGVAPARRRQWLQVGIAGFAFGNIMLFSLPRYLGLDSSNGPLLPLVFGVLSLLLAAPVVFYSAADYWQSAWHSVRQRRLTLDVPIALGLAALYAQSGFEILSGRGEGYLDSLAGLVFFLLCGRAFQQKTHDRLAFDRDYKSFFPLAVTRVHGSRREEAPTGQVAMGQSLPTSAAANRIEQRISLSQLRVGDCVRVRNGELIPADSRLLGGPALIDYGFVTGEADPVAKQPGDYLHAGGRQTGAAIEVETLKPVSQGYLTSLWDHEAFRKDREDDLHTLTNRYSRRFTRVVLAVAAGAAIFWLASGNPARGVKAFTAVLIVACPCALALVAPFTLGTAQRLLARIGVCLKNVLVLERLARVEAIVFDKTGTLTSPGANPVHFKGDVLAPDEAGWIQALTRHSTHPFSVRLSESLAAPEEAMSVEDFRESPGSGLEGTVQGRRILLGSKSWLESRGVQGIAVRSADFQSAVSPTFGRPGVRSARRPQTGSLRYGRPEVCATTPARFKVAMCGQETVEAPAEPPVPRASWRIESLNRPLTRPVGSAVQVAIDGRYRGAFVLSSAVRPETDRLLRELGSRYELALLSGDHEREQAVFQELFGSRAQLRFNQTPLDKLRFITGLQESGRTVMMVGDGLNDAGALRQSDVGVAVVENLGAFSPASDVIVEASLVPRLGEMLALARRARRIVGLGFLISALYNLVGISIAAAGILSPMICAILMPLSSLSVVLFACGMTAWAARGLSPKSKIRNPREIQNPKFDAATEAIRTSDFGLPSDFEFRTSDFSKP